MIRLALLALLLLAAGGAYGAERRRALSRRGLAGDQPRFEQRLGQLYQLGLWDFMDGPEKQALADVQLRFPLIGANGHPFDFYADHERGRPTI